MTSSLAPLRPLRPEIPALIAAIDTAMDHIDARGHHGRVIVLDLGLAKDLLETIEDICPDHKRCDACGEDVACEVCGIGHLTGWCLHRNLCPECRQICTHCAAEEA